MFGKKKNPAEPGLATVPLDSAVLGPVELLARLSEEMDACALAGVELSVIRAVPQLLAGETLSQRESELVNACIARQIRDTDIVGRLDDESYVAILPGTSEPAAQAVAQRIASELTIRSGFVARHKWLAVGLGCTTDLASAADVLARAAAMARLNNGLRRAA